MHGFSHMLASSLVHGVIYGAIYKLMRHLTLPEVIGMAAVVLVGVYLWMHQSRPSRGSTGTRGDRPDE